MDKRGKAANPKTEVELRAAVKKAYKALAKEIVANCVADFPKRLQMRIDAHGAQFEYKK